MRRLPDKQSGRCYCGGDLILERRQLSTLEELRSFQGIPYAGDQSDLPARAMTYTCRNASQNRPDGCGRAWRLAIGPKGVIGRHVKGSIDPFFDPVHDDSPRKAAKKA